MVKIPAGEFALGFGPSSDLIPFMSDKTAGLNAQPKQTLFLETVPGTVQNCPTLNVPQGRHPQLCIRKGSEDITGIGHYNNYWPPRVLFSSIPAPCISHANQAFRPINFYHAPV